MDVSVIVATMNREKELIRCIDSINVQTVRPRELIIIDDGDLDQKRIERVISDEMEFKYHKKDNPGLSASRNIGARIAEADLVLFLDDDVVLEPNYIEKILEVFENDGNRELGGVSGTIINRDERPRFFKYWERVFLLNLGKEGAILPWGFYTRVEKTDKVIQTDWIPGGLSCFRRRVFEEFQLYDFKDYGHKGGRHGLADLEFSLRLSPKYKLAVIPSARLYHYKAEPTKEQAFQAGYKQAFNHGVIFARHCKKSLINVVCFGWAMIGLILGNFGAVFVVSSRNKRQERLYRALGNIKGFILFLLRG